MITEAIILGLWMFAAATTRSCIALEFMVFSWGLAFSFSVISYALIFLS